MKNQLTISAKHLLGELKVPPGMASVLIWSDGGMPFLKVWVDKRYFSWIKTTIPKTYDGYNVVLEEKPHISALSC